MFTVAPALKPLSKNIYREAKRTDDQLTELHSMLPSSIHIPTAKSSQPRWRWKMFHLLRDLKVNILSAGKFSLKYISF